MTSSDLSAADAILSNQLDLFRLSAHVQEQALAVLDRMGRELEGRLRDESLTELGRERLTRLLKQTSEVIDRYYTQLSATVEAGAKGAGAVQGNVIRQALTTVLISVDVSLPTTTFLNSLLSKALIEGAQSGAWWKRQAGDTAFRFASAVQQGLVAGETNEAIVSRVAGTTTKPGVITISKRNARSLVHASIQSAANAARRETYMRNADIIKGIRQVSTFDSHTTEICIAYSGATWDLDLQPIGTTRLPYNGGVPRHWGCRSVEVPIMKTFAELGLKGFSEPSPGQRASVDGPIDARTTMKQFLDRKGAEFQDAVLGKGRAAMYRKGIITLQQLLDLRGNPLTLKQLQRRYA